MDHKGNKQWVWLALDVDTRKIVGVYIGARDGVAEYGYDFPKFRTSLRGSSDSFIPTFSNVQGTKRQPVNYGIPCLRFTASVQLLTLISGQPME